MDFSNFSALTTPELHNIPSPPYQSSTFSNPHSTASQHSTTSASYSSTPPSTTSLKKETPASAATAANRKRGRDDAGDEDDDAAVKRHRNTLAARKYRQKRLDRIKELEDALGEMTGERDELRIKLARQEAENEALKTMMKMRAEK